MIAQSFVQFFYNTGFQKATASLYCYQRGEADFMIILSHPLLAYFVALPFSLFMPCNRS